MATSVYMHVGPSEQAARAAGRPVPQPGRQTRPRPPVAEHTPYGPAGPHAGHPLAVYGAAEGPAPGARPPAPALAEHAEGDDESSRYLVISYVRNLAPGAPPLRLDIYLLACERASWHPGRIPFANYSAYTAYFREVLPTPRRMNIFHSSRAVGAMTIAGISLCVLIAGAATPPRNVVLLAVGLSGLGLSAVVLLYFLVRILRARSAHRARGELERQAAECAQAGRMPPVETLGICKFCTSKRSFERGAYAVCRRPEAVALPPTVACIDRLGASYHRYMLKLLRQIQRD